MFCIYNFHNRARKAIMEKHFFLQMKNQVMERLFFSPNESIFSQMYISTHQYPDFYVY